MDYPKGQIQSVRKLNIAKNIRNGNLFLAIFHWMHES